jgi:hypothetical protein
VSATPAESLAQQHLRRLGVPSKLHQSYEKDDAVHVLQGIRVDSAIYDSIHLKLAWIVGVQLVGHINGKFPDLRWSDDRVAVRTLIDGEASASFLSFEDGSHAVLVSRALQENLIRMANVIEYFDISRGLAKLSLRRSKRQRESFETAARLSAVLRYLLLGQRMHGVAPSAPAKLDKRSFDIAGKMATGALMFVVAHEIAHIAHGHESISLQPHSPDGPVTISEVQELQADVWALHFLTEFMADDPAPENIALWCAFIALFAMQVTERTVHVRRNRTHPEAWARWATLEQQATKADDRTERLRLGFMAALMGASKLDEAFPEEVWPLLWKDAMLSVEPSITVGTLTMWDRLQSAPLDELSAKAASAATADGKVVLTALQRGELADVFRRVVAKPRHRERLLDPRTALGFSTLREVFANASPALANGDQTGFSVVCARLAAVHLGGGETS